MSLLPKDGRMQPILLLPEGAMKAEDIKRLNDNGICTVECKDPHAIKFLDPIPSAANRGRHEEAALSLARKVLDRKTFDYDGKVGFSSVAQMYIAAIVHGTALDPSIEHQQIVFDDAKMDEIRRLAREEARAERAAKKEAEKKAAEAKAKESKK